MFDDDEDDDFMGPIEDHATRPNPNLENQRTIEFHENTTDDAFTKLVKELIAEQRENNEQYEREMQKRMLENEIEYLKVKKEVLEGQARSNEIWEENRRIYLNTRKKMGL